MPRTAITYSESCVYGLEKDQIIHYVGSTTNFKKRKGQHKRNSTYEKRKSYNFPIYKFIRESGGWKSGWKMVLIQQYSECKSSQELLSHEREHYDIINPELNSRSPFITDEEKREKNRQYNKENKDKIYEYQKQYNIINKEKVQESRKQYRIDNEERLKEYSKQYNIENDRSDYHAQYRADNYDERNKSCACECGKTYTYQNKSRHLKSIFHIKSLDGK
jgi:hypothetical protein